MDMSLNHLLATILMCTGMAKTYSSIPNWMASDKLEVLSIALTRYFYEDN